MFGGQPETLCTPCDIKCNLRMAAALQEQRRGYEEQMSLNGDVSTGEVMGVVLNAGNIAKSGWKGIGHVALGLVCGAAGGYAWHGLKKALFNHHEPNSR